ncbi:MAG: response regulator [Phycisphaeraceae bacterium]|nr:response regulator [Phycisphaeraceae bacterium]MCB9848828.1 response regulator [Phycisphaeraceae bacterium]
MITEQKPVHFLLVEDNQDHADLVRMSLEINNVTNTLDHVRDGLAAMAYLRNSGEYGGSKRPDVILLDINLPKMNGHEILEQIKADEDLKVIPVVVLTTSAADADRLSAYRSHANSFVTKPVDFQKFQNMIRDLNLYWTVWNQAPTHSHIPNG